MASPDYPTYEQLLDEITRLREIVEGPDIDTSTPDPADESWRDRAACLGAGTMFYPEKGQDTTDAKVICAGCPVTAECLEFALVGYEKFGVWGGKSERERRKIRIQRQKDGTLGPPPEKPGAHDNFHWWPAA